MPWVIAALGGLMFAAGGNERVSEGDALVIGFVAIGLVLAIHLAPPAAALLIATAVAAHTLLMAGLVGAEWWRSDSAASPERRP